VLIDSNPEAVEIMRMRLAAIDDATTDTAAAAPPLRRARAG
jgi:hypothetical protein